MPIPTPPSPPIVQLDSVNTLINDSWRFFSRHAKNLVTIAAIVVLVQLVFLVVAVALGILSGLSETKVITQPTTITVIIVAVVFGLAIAGISIWSSVALYYYIIKNDAALGVRSAYAQSRRMILPYLGTSLLVGLITFGGLLLLIVPGFYWGVLYSFAPLIVLAEGRGVPALTRSKALVKGNWWAVGWRNFVFSLLMIGIAVGVSIFFSTLFSILGRLYSPLTSLRGFGQYFATLVTTPLGAVFAYHLYRSLRRAKGES